MHNKCITIDKILQLKEWLPHGSVQRIHENTGLSKTMVSRVLAGRRYNPEIIEAAIKIAEEEKNKAEALANRINRIQTN